MKNALTRGLGGLLILLLTMGATAATASADEGEWKGLDILDELEQDQPTSTPPAEPVQPLTYEELSPIGSQYSYYNTPSTGLSRKAAKAIADSRIASSSYRKAFAEEFNRCMAYTGHKSKKEQNECVTKAKAAGEAADTVNDTTEIIDASDTHEQGMLPDGMDRHT